MADASFAIAAAHDITPRMVATWDKFLLRSPRVLVPVRLDVLMVRDDAEVAANCLMTTPADDAPGLKRLDLLPPPFAELDKPRARGAYLHWALPDGLTHGTTDGKTAEFYAVPDRWLVLRLSPGFSIFQTPRRALRGWVLRAGDKVPTVTDLDAWVETGPAADEVQGPLTAVGHGDPAWAAYYENVVNRLGFYDDLAGVESGPIAYLVCGWYSDPKADPLGDPQILSLNDFNATLRSLNWSIDPTEWHESVRKRYDFVKAATLIGLTGREFTGSISDPESPAPAAPPAVRAAALAATTARSSATATVLLGATPAPLDDSGLPAGGAYTTDGSWWPSATIYHGAVVGIGWPGVGWPGNEGGLLADPARPGVASGEFGGPPPAGSINVVVGNTITEALGALVARTNNKPEEARILEAFLLGSLNELDKPDGQAQIDDLLHSVSFATRDGGFVTETIRQPAMPATPPPPPTPTTPDPGVFRSQTAIHVGPNFEGILSSSLRNDIGIASARTFGSAEQFVGLTVVKGGLAGAFAQIANPSLLPPAQPARTIEVQRALPRYFQPADPVFLIQGGERSFKHGADGVHSQDGSLICRLTGFCVTELSCAAVTIEGVTTPARHSVVADDLLVRGVENGSVPLECDDLLRELALLDPGSAAVAARTTTTLVGAALQAQERNFLVEQTAVYAARDPRFDAAPLVARSGITGTIASSIAFNLPVRPWNPIHLDWQVEFSPTPGPSATPAPGAADWQADEIDFLGVGTPPPPGAAGAVILSGRAHLTGGAAQTAAQGVRTALSQATAVAGTDPLPPNIAERFHSEMASFLLEHLDSLSGLLATAPPPGGDRVPANDRSFLTDIANALESIDVLTGALDNFHTRLRGGLTGDGVTVTDPPGAAPPSPFFPVRVGYLRVLRLRLVDGFGQFVDLAGSSDTTTADPAQIVTSGPASVPSAPGLMALPPRFTSPARLWFRFVSATDDDTDATADVGPVCGFLLPNHLDGDLEFFDPEGVGLGAVRPDSQAGVAWDDAPGRPSTVGRSPAQAIADPHAAGIAQALIRWGTADAEVPGAREDALSALLRIVDSTLWSVDPFGHTGDEHLSLLLGHPVAVLRARLRIEVAEPVDPGAVDTRAFPVRLGSLAHWQDGLFGYFVNDDYDTLYCADGAAAYAREVGPNRGFLQQINLVPDFYATFAEDIGAGVGAGKSPVDHPFVDTTGLLWVVPNQTYRLTLLVEPHTTVHATTGLLPRKEIGTRREWVADALAKIAPTFRFGPLLVDPKRIRMPIPREIQGTWSWDHRVDVAAWAEDPVTNTTGDAILSPDPARGTEGWLKLGPPPAAGDAPP